MRKLQPWLLGLVALLALAGGGFVIWASVTPAPMAEALAALQSDNQVQVETGTWLVFRPAAQPPGVGLILYPGARVDPRSYAPEARAIAVQGTMVVIVPMPLNLAIFGADRASDVIKAFPTIHRWAIGGHSLGGAMAARFVYTYPDVVQGLVLWAAYPANTDDLSSRDLVVVSVYGTRDGLATPEKVDPSRRLLPASTRLEAIEGGNHAQFGWYGPQAGDHEATISREEQQARTVQATVALLQSLK